MKKLQKQMLKRQKTLMERERSPGKRAVLDYDGPKKTVEIRYKKDKKTVEVPTFDQNGRRICPHEDKKRRKTIGILSAVAGICLLVYAPQFLEGKKMPSNPLQIVVQTDMEAIRSSNSILRENSTEDFDGDGILNTDETSAGTDPWRIDSDNDGVTDYAELHITGTSPTEWTAVLQDIRVKMDKSEEKTLANPYRIGELILWPDSYEAKSYGSVVETMDGRYRFCGFSGNVLFQGNEDKQAYKFENGIHSILQQDEMDETWIVHDGDLVELCDKKLQELFRFSFFGFEVDVGNNVITRILDALLPKKGFVTSVKITEADVQRHEEILTQNEIVKPFFKENDSERLKSNMTTLGSLKMIRDEIDKGNCVAVSLFNRDQGEYLGIIYGYSDTGDLLVADMDSLEEQGRIHITEKARRMFNEEGEIVSLHYFDWDAFGFSSRNNDRISFFACSEKKEMSQVW